MIYDLSQPVFHDAPHWSTYPSIRVTLEHKISVHGFNAEQVQFTTHSGTHIDAPFHFVEGAETVDQLPLEYFFAPALTLDFRAKKPGATINADDLRAALQYRDVKDCIVLLKTGWGDRRGFTKEFLHQYPYLTGDGAELLVEQGIKGVGTECLSIGGFEPGEGAPPHLALLRARKLIVEDLHIPDAFLDGHLRWFAAFPIKIKGASAAWTRAVAWDGEEFPSELLQRTPAQEKRG